jgi:ferredoxin-thioredoxin reductase catalytic subunit
MNNEIIITQDLIDKTYKQLKEETEAGGYFLNPDESFTKDLINSLLINDTRFGYWACPCRLASGKKKEDIDIICPCYYRDSDLNEYNACFCGLYVSKKVFDGKIKIKPIPERRPILKERKKMFKKKNKKTMNLNYPIWRCNVCGYLCARDNPPEICPICKAKKERFEKFV